MRSPFMSPVDKRELADATKREFALENSDHLTLLKAYDGWQAARAAGQERPFLNRNFLSRQVTPTRTRTRLSRA